MANIIQRASIMTFVAVVLSLGQVASVRVAADPTDDFSFAFADGTGSDYALMSEEEVAGILRDHLKTFPQSQIPKLSRHLLQLCRKYRFDPAFILSMVQVESGFRVNVVSYAGAVGLMQLMPGTAQVVSKRHKIRYTGERSLKDPFINLSLGVAYLSDLRQRYRGTSPYFHIAAYNLGPTKLDELRKSETFKPVNTKIYYEKIRRGVPKLRFHKLRDLV